MNEESSYQAIIKIVLIGEASVGKTSLLIRYSESRFDPTLKATMGMDFVSKDLVISGQSVRAQFWDTAGQEKFKALASSYFKVADGLVFVYDVTRRESLAKAAASASEVEALGPKNAVRLLVGNKSDLVASRQVTPEEGKRLAEEKGMFFFETSAMTNEDGCVNKAFDCIVEEATKRCLEFIKKMNAEDGNQEQPLGRPIGKQNLQKSNGCCSM